VTARSPAKPFVTSRGTSSETDKESRKMQIDFNFQTMGIDPGECFKAAASHDARTESRPAWGLFRRTLLGGDTAFRDQERLTEA
jgi:hypothetical protein